MKIIRRKEIDEIGEWGWYLIYGRRKTGKTFSVMNFLKNDYYFFVKKSGIIMIKGKEIKDIDYNFFKSILPEIIDKDLKIVIDEFQRLPDDFSNLLHALSFKRKGRLILLGSSMRVIKEIFSPKSPLLGLFSIIKFDIIDPVTIVNEFEDPLEWIFLREPWLLEDYDGDVKRVLYKKLENVSGLIGEIFDEEERELTEMYEGVMRAISLGAKFPKEVASYVGKSSGEVRVYMENLVEMGILKKIKVWKKRKHIYLMRSPIFDLYYHLDSKYSFFDIGKPEEIFNNVLEEKIPLYFENFVREFFAYKLGGVEEKCFDPEIDGIITVGKKPVLVLEAKFGKITKKDKFLFEEKTKEFDCKRIIVNPETLKEIKKQR